MYVLLIISNFPKAALVRLCRRSAKAETKKIYERNESFVYEG